MSKNKENAKMEEVNSNISSKNQIRRRTMLKALAGIPVFGVFALELMRKREYEFQKKSQLIKELGIGDIQAPNIIKSRSSGKGDLLRIGIVGFGARAPLHANGLGYMHPSDILKRKENNTLKDWLAQEDLNVALTGICDVFDLHAKRGIETAQNEIHPDGVKASGLQVKRYRTFQEMIDDKNIDAVMIATPDHHHAPMAIAAAKAGKHVYCEKSIALHEAELNELYKTVKQSSIVFQLGHQITQSVTFQQAKEIINKGILGKITLVQTTTNRNSADGAWIRHQDKDGNPKPGDEKTIDWTQWLGSTPPVAFSIDRFYNWQKWFAYETGLIGQLFTHEFDAVNQLLRIGIPKSVTSSGGIYFWKDNREMPDLLHCVFEYPNHDLTLLYSASLASSLSRGRIFMGHDASLELGGSVNITVDGNSTRYKRQIETGIIDPSSPMISLNPGLGKIDAVTTPTEKYYASRGLISTSINGREFDLTYLHIKEWIDCIRNGSVPSSNIELGFEEGIACLMAHRSYLEKRAMEWDPVNRVIV